MFSSSEVITYKYMDTLSSKNKMKKLLLLKFLGNSMHTPTNLTPINITIIGVKYRNKNVLLSSPFHFKTVKTHVYIPTFTYTFSFCSQSQYASQEMMSMMGVFKLPGMAHSVFTNCVKHYKI